VLRILSGRDTNVALRNVAHYNNGAICNIEIYAVLYLMIYNLHERFLAAEKTLSPFMPEKNLLVRIPTKACLRPEICCIESKAGVKETNLKRE
jgi:hypothetical protein